MYRMGRHTFSRKKMATSRRNARLAADDTDSALEDDEGEVEEEELGAEAPVVLEDDDDDEATDSVTRLGYTNRSSASAWRMACRS
jgi:hypothetical protein